MACAPNPAKKYSARNSGFVALDTARSTSINPSFERFPSFKKMLTLAGFHGLSSYHPLTPLFLPLSEASSRATDEEREAKGVSILQASHIDG